MSTNDDRVNDISQKLNILIALSLKRLTIEEEVRSGAKQKPRVGENARFLAGMGLSAGDISKILGAPVTSIRTLLTPGRRK